MLKKQKTNDSSLPNVKKNILFGVILGGTNMRYVRSIIESTRITSRWLCIRWI